MKNGIRMFAFVAMVTLLGVIFSATPTQAQTERQVYAFYFGWWTEGSWNDGRLIDRPAAPYDSRDAGAVGRHIDQARGVGIDAFIMSWFGPKDNNLTHQVFNILLDQAGARGFKAGAAVDMHEAGYNNSVDEVRASLSHLIGDRVHHPAYLRYDGKPVIYFWNQGRFSVAQWREIRSQVDPDHNTIWVMEGSNTSYLTVFDGLYLFNTVWSNNPAATANTWQTRTQQAGGWFYTPTVLPGWNDVTGRANPTATRDRADGQYLTRSWNGAAASGASVILITSWNEYFENSHIEPSQNHGTQAVDILRPLIAEWKSGGGGHMSPPGEAAPLDGVTYTVHYNMRLRDAPGDASNVLATIPFDTVVAVTGRTADNGWLLVNYHGQAGWVATGYGQLSASIDSVPVAP
jgi:hypothetical protein